MQSVAWILPLADLPLGWTWLACGMAAFLRQLVAFPVLFMRNPAEADLPSKTLTARRRRSFPKEIGEIVGALFKLYSFRHDVAKPVPGTVNDDVFYEETKE